MKRQNFVFLHFFAFLLLAFISGCKKEILKEPPTIETTIVTDITFNSFISGGKITSDGGAEIVKRGVCWNTSRYPTITNFTTSNGTGTGTGIFTSPVTGLQPGTNYYVKAYAVNSEGVGYSQELTITTVALTATLTTTAVSNVGSTTVTSGGSISADGGSAVSARGVCWATTQNPVAGNSKTTDGTGTGSYTSTLTGLLPGTTYYLRAYAVNEVGTAYGAQVTVATLAVPPTLTTTAFSTFTSTTAISGGEITFEGGAVTARGVCWSTDPNPTIANSKTTDGIGIGTFTSSITGLVSGTTYYIRAYATNSAGTAYGGQLSFLFLSQGLVSETFTDIDGNVYHAVNIGTQTWMVENLKTTKYRNGDLIPHLTDSLAWVTSVIGAYCWYNNDPGTYKADYGALYNWYTTADSRNIAPSGWHVPSSEEFTVLANYLGGRDVAGDKLKESGTNHWLAPNNGTNVSGFTGLPGGARGWYWSETSGLGENGYFWTTTSKDAGTAWFRWFPTGDSAGFFLSNEEKPAGNSVRCVRD
jgi:uncharacterized protein (TIGR02145 family)